MTLEARDSQLLFREEDWDDLLVEKTKRYENYDRRVSVWSFGDTFFGGDEPKPALGVRVNPWRVAKGDAVVWLVYSPEGQLLRAAHTARRTSLYYSGGIYRYFCAIFCLTEADPEGKQPFFAARIGTQHNLTTLAEWQQALERKALKATSMQGVFDREGEIEKKGHYDLVVAANKGKLAIAIEGRSILTGLERNLPPETLGLLSLASPCPSRDEIGNYFAQRVFPQMVYL